MRVIYNKKKILFFVHTLDTLSAEHSNPKKTILIISDIDKLPLYNNFALVIVSTEDIDAIVSTLQKKYTYAAHLCLKDPLLRYFNEKDLEIIRRKSLHEIATNANAITELCGLSDNAFLGFRMLFDAPVTEYLTGFGSNFQAMTLHDIVRETKSETFDHIKSIFRNIQNRSINQLFSSK